jgi:hypothetical protein
MRVGYFRREARTWTWIPRHRGMTFVEALEAKPQELPSSEPLYNFSEAHCTMIAMVLGH